MPEGPEVRRYALQLADALEGGEILHFSARTKAAKAWLLEHVPELVGQEILEVRSHGKHLYGRIAGGYGFHSHLMMWGRWFVHAGDQILETDRRERARIATSEAIAILFFGANFRGFRGRSLRPNRKLGHARPRHFALRGRVRCRRIYAKIRRARRPRNRRGAVRPAHLRGHRQLHPRRSAVLLPVESVRPRQKFDRY